MGINTTQLIFRNENMDDFMWQSENLHWGITRCQTLEKYFTHINAIVPIILSQR